MILYQRYENGESISVKNEADIERTLKYDMRVVYAAVLSKEEDGVVVVVLKSRSITDPYHQCAVRAAIEHFQQKYPPVKAGTVEFTSPGC